MKLVLKMMLMSLGLFIVLPAFGDWVWRHEQRRAYDGPGRRCHTNWCRDRYNQQYKKETTTTQQTPYGKSKKIKKSERKITPSGEMIKTEEVRFE